MKDSITSPILQLKTSELTGQSVLFDEEEHTYHTLSGEELIGTSSFIAQFKPKFDPDGSILRRCALKRGITVETLRAEWDQTRDDASDKGKQFHSDIENFIKRGELPDNDNLKLIEYFAKHFVFNGKLFSEQIVYSEKYKTAGTIDLIELLKRGEINIYDFKTNKALHKKARFGKHMLVPINHLPECNFMHYTLQLSLYALMLEELGYWVKNMALFYINPETQEIENHPIFYKRKEILSILEYHEMHNTLTF